MKVSWYISTFGGFQSIGVPPKHPLVCGGILHLWNAHVNFFSFICPSSFQTWPCRWGVKDSQCPGFSPVFWKSIGGPSGTSGGVWTAVSHGGKIGMSQGFHWDFIGISLGFYWDFIGILWVLKLANGLQFRNKWINLKIVSGLILCVTPLIAGLTWPLLIAGVMPCYTPLQWATK